MASDTNLIHGEMAMRQAQGTGSIIGKAVGKTVADAWGVVEAEQDAIDKQVQDYMDQGELTIDAFGVPEHFKSPLAEFSVPNRNDYAAIARRAAKQKPGSAAQLESLAEMNKIASEFKTMRTQIDQWVAERDQYLNGKKNLNYSKANGVLGTEAQMARMFTGKGQMSFQNGNLAFLNEDGTTTLFKDMPHLIKKHTGMTPIYQKAVNTAHKGGVRLSEQDMKNYTQLFTSKFEETGFGRDAVLSAATDGIVIGNDVIDLKIDPELIKDPARADELRDLVVSQLVNSVAASAESAAVYKEEKAGNLSNFGGKDVVKPRDTTRSFETMKEAFRTNDFTAYIGAKVGDKVITGVSRDSKDQNLLLVTREGSSEPILINLTKRSDRMKLRSWDASRGGYRGGEAVYKQNEDLPFKLAESTQAPYTLESGKSTITDLGGDGGLGAREAKAVKQLSGAFPDFKFKGVGRGPYNTILVTAPNKKTKKFSANVYWDPTDANEAMYEWMEDNQSVTALP